MGVKKFSQNKESTISRYIFATFTREKTLTSHQSANKLSQNCSRAVEHWSLYCLYEVLVASTFSTNKYILPSEPDSIIRLINSFVRINT